MGIDELCGLRLGVVDARDRHLETTKSAADGRTRESKGSQADMRGGMESLETANNTLQVNNKEQVAALNAAANGAGMLQKKVDEFAAHVKAQVQGISRLESMVKEETQRTTSDKRTIARQDEERIDTRKGLDRATAKNVELPQKLLEARDDTGRLAARLVCSACVHDSHGKC